MTRVRLLFLWTALAVALWCAAAWGWEIWWRHNRGIGVTLFTRQDMPALLMGSAALLAAAFWPRGRAGMPDYAIVTRRGPMIALFALVALACWALTYILFSAYGLSRDEEVAIFGAAYLREGLLARPIPSEWIDFRRAIMPEFFSPYGADRYWAMAYLPVNSAVRAFWTMLGDANLTGPAWLFAGLLALWRVALRLFPGRPDAVVVVLILAAGSAQLLLTAMTAYAMTAHFALNMVWLALVLHDRRASHLAAALLVPVMAGLHQWHFPLIFLAPFLLWFALQRRWGLVLLYGGAMAAAVLIWARLWPMLLHAQLGPPADVAPPAGVGDKMESLIRRLDKWHPLLHLGRFLAWNNLLLLPLAAMGVWSLRWRRWFSGETPVLPLALGCAGAGLLAIDQGYGWGYRYLHGYIGGFALLAGYGWIALRGASLRPIWLSLLIALFLGGFLAEGARRQVAPYARAHALIHASRADVVLVDARGGWYVTDLVRGRAGQVLDRPIVLNLAMLDAARLDRLCERYSIAIFDRSLFPSVGLEDLGWDSARLRGLRAHMAARGCGAPLTSPR